MNNKNIIGILLVALAALSAFLIVEPVGAELVRGVLAGWLCERQRRLVP